MTGYTLYSICCVIDRVSEMQSNKCSGQYEVLQMLKVYASEKLVIAQGGNHTLIPTKKKLQVNRNMKRS